MRLRAQPAQRRAGLEQALDHALEGVELGGLGLEEIVVQEQDRARVGLVSDLGADPARQPLLYYRGRYGVTADPEES